MPCNLILSTYYILLEFQTAAMRLYGRLGGYDFRHYFGVHSRPS